MNMNMEMKMDMVTKTMEVNKSFLHCPKEEKCSQNGNMPPVHVAPASSSPKVRPAQNHDS